MANYLDSLIHRIEDEALRADLIREIASLRNRKDFGLVFERHLPETVRLYSQPVTVGATVQERADNDGPLWTVRKVAKANATVERRDGTEVLSGVVPIEDLVVVRRFGDAMYPGLTSLGRIDRGGVNRPWHAVIESENYHALETLLYAYEGEVDCIYIDPPYNKGKQRDWKYNNDYVDEDDAYRHSKWLAFMERRLLVAKELLNPLSSVLIVAIDETEVHRLGLLLDQVFRSCEMQTVTVVSNPAGSPRAGRFTRVEEYLLFVFLGTAEAKKWRTSMLNGDVQTPKMPSVWFSAARVGGGAALRANRTTPVLYYPVHLDAETGALHSIGSPFPRGESIDSYKPPAGTIAIWPLAEDGTEQTWRFDGEQMTKRFNEGTVRLGKRDPVTGHRSVTYLRPGTLKKIETGEYQVVGRTEEGALELALLAGGAAPVVAPAAVWKMQSHFARDYGTALIKTFVPGGTFPFPKSLYAVEDALRIAVKDKPDAVVLDFFGGSGTTTHAVVRLNRQDGGHRRSIIVTNNEVSAAEADAFADQGIRPGDPAWEALGIFEHMTRPRISAAITGQTSDGEPVRGVYKFTDEFAMADGFEESVEFFRLDYLDRDDVNLGRAFEAVAPLLWLKAGGVGSRIDKITKPWALPVGGVYGVLFDPQHWAPFARAVQDRADEVRHAFVVTDSTSVFQQVVAELPTGIATTMLYEDYLSTFAINTGGRR